MEYLRSRFSIALLLSLSNSAAAVPESVNAALKLDDECWSVDSGSCALGLSQRLATKRKVVQTGRSNTIAQDDEEFSVASVDYGHPAWLDACAKVFLDLGSRKGVNVRMLFEGPEKYSGARMLPYMDSAFGTPAERSRRTSVSGICALGFEPDQRQHARLHKLEQSYLSRGWHTHFYPFAAWSGEGFMPFNTTSKRGESSGDAPHLSMSGGVRADSQETMVRTVDLAEFVSSLPKGSVQLLMMDIEGAEYQTIAQLIQKNILCQGKIRSMLVETHPWGEIMHWGDNTSFHKDIHPRSFSAVRQRVDQLREYDWCAPGQVADVYELIDSMYSDDVDDQFD